MFQGYTDETFEFFMAIRFNNNREFFQSNHDWYLRAVREPSLALVEALAPAVEALDDDLELRPNRVVSRINRDIRFSHDKSPYRDYIWLAFRRPGANRKSTLGVYFDLSDSGASYGMGFYDENRPLMNALRRRLLTEPEAFLHCWQPVRSEFTLYAQTFKRMAIPEDLHPDLAAWYPAKGFYLEKEIHDFNLLKSSRLADEIISGYERLAPLYRYIHSIPYESDAGETRTPLPMPDPFL